MKYTLRFVVGFTCLALGLLTAPGQEVGAPAVGIGTKIESLTVGATTYRQVQVRSVNASTLMISYAGGMTSIHLKNLSPEWQARFHYDSVADAAAEDAAKKAAPPPAVVVHREKSAAVSAFDSLLLQFGQPAEVQPEIDLRPKFFQLELRVKNQGRRPSCAVFAVVSALEFQNAEIEGKAEKFSEEYLIWAVRKTVQRIPDPSNAGPEDASGKDYQDEGFALSEVVAALRTYGIPLQASMPNTFGRRIDAIEDPPATIIQEARSYQRVFAHPVPGRNRATLLNNIVQALNRGLPVAVGMNWPMIRVINGYLNTQVGAPDRGHAVTLVGYKSATGRIEDASFIFKNSWGPAWGQGGYGIVTYHYLHSYLNDAILLEVRRS